MSDRYKDRYWDDREGLTHRVPFTIGGLYTTCGIRIAWAPGCWTERTTTCLACLGDSNTETPRPLLERVALYWAFKWPVRMAVGMIHGVPSNSKVTIAKLVTYCGINTYAKLSKGTGRWTHKDEAMTCIGCLAVSGVR